MDPIVRSASQRKSLLYGAFVAEWMGDALHGDSLNWHELHFVVVGISCNRYLCWECAYNNTLQNTLSEIMR